MKLTKLLKFLLCLWLAMLATCHPQPWPRPVSMGSVGALCEMGRPIWCEKGEPLCVNAEQAVKEINAVVPGLLVWKGQATHEQLAAMTSDSNQRVTFVIRGVGVPEAYAGLPIAMTMLHAEAKQACLLTMPIIIIWPLGALNQADWNQVILHELMHSIGADHAGEDCPYSSVEHPSLQEEHRVGLSGTDINWLRAVYAE